MRYDKDYHLAWAICELCDKRYVDYVPNKPEHANPIDICGDNCKGLSGIEDSTEELSPAVPGAKLHDSPVSEAGGQKEDNSPAIRLPKWL